VLTETGSTFNINHYQGTATISSTAKTTATNVGNNKNKTTGSKPSSCANVTHYGYTANRTVDEVGKMTPTVPHASSLNQTNLNVLAGNIESGLFCATNASGTYCDANGTAIEQGQTGSNYTKQCVTTGFIFTTTTCSPAPTGPQQVVASGWLSGKTVQQLSVGRSGFTCALASNSIGCWGLNSYGQLGTGDTVNKLVPTALKP
jgi:hypothetical protein